MQKEYLTTLMGDTLWFIARKWGKAVRFEPELGDWSCWKLWMDKNDFLSHRQEGPEIQFRAGQRSADLPGHPHNLEENRFSRFRGLLLFCHSTRLRFDFMGAGCVEQFSGALEIRLCYASQH